MSNHTKKVNLYLLAGVATAPHFMESFRLAMTARFKHAGYAVHSELIFPYGDWSRKLLPQLNELRQDLWGSSRNHRLPLQSVGGRRTAVWVRHRRDDGLSMLIGHSGGGIAAVHAACILSEEQAFHREAPIRVVQIGSPKCPIPEWLTPYLLYASAINSKKLPSDPVTMLGSWKGWRLHSSFGLPLSQWAALTSPSSTLGLPLIGGHPDYFRENPPFLNKDGISNLEITAQALWSWLSLTFEREAY